MKNRELEMTELVLARAGGLGAEWLCGKGPVFGCQRWLGSTRAFLHGTHRGSIWQPLVCVYIYMYIYICCVGVHVLHASSLCHRTNIYTLVM